MSSRAAGGPPIPARARTRVHDFASALMSIGGWLNSGARCSTAILTRLIEGRKSRFSLVAGFGA